MTEINTVYLYLLAPLHTGGTTQEGNLLGIARESHTNLPYIPSSTIRGRLRASAPDDQRDRLFGNELKDGKTSDGSDNLTQGNIWVGDGSILWIPVPSLSHGVIWITAPMLLRRWARHNGKLEQVPEDGQYLCNFKKADSSVYLKDAMFKADDLQDWPNWEDFGLKSAKTSGIKQVMLIPDRHCATLIQMSLWRQVKVKLDSHKTVDGGFRYEEAIPPDTVMYFTWGMTAQVKGSATDLAKNFTDLLEKQNIMQIGGQESLGRGFVTQWQTN
ncbi:MAG: type III-B CRISPR module RAMP protein Cmr4 [Spirulinaceae cyanobacterium SM2_1_0]|nr:type III-B CRISPR module RAMP protein Cmr4 [Spirulinaceae cyanobacterium SM2_1_0]